MGKALDILKYIRNNDYIMDFLDKAYIKEAIKELEAAKKAVAVVDECLGKIADKILEKNGSLLVTADHGNVDLMVDPVTGVPFTQHTTNQVPLLLVSNEYKGVGLKENGKLADLAPTMLDILGIEKPVEMDGESLIKK